MTRGVSIRTKLALYAFAAASVGVLMAMAMSFLALTQSRDAVPSYLRARSVPLAKAVRLASLEPIAPGRLAPPSAARLRAALSIVVSDAEIRQAAIRAPDGGFELVVPDGAAMPASLSVGYDPGSLRLVTELPEGVQVALWYDEQRLYEGFVQAVIRIGLSLLTAAVTAILFASLAGRWIARPIAQLAHLARSIPESGDFDVSTPSESFDEVGQLRAAFGEMWGKVERRERALQEARRNAEQAALQSQQMAAQAQATADALAAETAARERTQRQLEQAQKMEALGRLAGGVAHDFNNLLFVIGTYTDDLTRRLEADDQEAIDQIQEAVRRATKLTQQLLSFSRQPRGEPVDVDVGQMLIRMEGLLRRLIGEDIALTVEGTHSRLVVRAPEGALESAVMNLVVNARDALPEGGSIKISMSPERESPQFAKGTQTADARWMRLSVEDDGLGMDESIRRQAFEPFFTTKPTGEGTGLGLTLVYALCRQLGGEVLVDSEAGHGTRFDLLLPLADADGGFSVDVHNMTPLPSEEGRVLVAEDDPQVRRLIVRVLVKAGFDVEAVEDGQAALTRLSEGPPVDLVVSDVVMPKMGGLDLANAIRQAGIDVPILFVSGYPAHPGQASAPFPPGLPMLRKPFTAQALRRQVRQMLGRHPITPVPFDPNVDSDLGPVTDETPDGSVDPDDPSEPSA